MVNREQIIKENALLNPRAWLMGKVAEEASEVSLAYLHTLLKDPTSEEFLVEFAHLKVAVEIYMTALELVGDTGTLHRIAAEEENKLEQIRKKKERQGEKHVCETCTRPACPGRALNEACSEWLRG